VGAGSNSNCLNTSSVAALDAAAEIGMEVGFLISSWATTDTPNAITRDSIITRQVLEMNIRIEFFKTFLRQD
jgi:hypothetical protein